MSSRRRWATPQERLTAIRLIQFGEPAERVAELMGVGRRTVFEWQQRYRQQGQVGIEAKVGTGRPRKLSEEQTKQLVDCLASFSPSDLRPGRVLWTRSLVQELLAVRFGVTVSRVTAARVLESIGVSAELPLCSAFRQNLAEVRMWEEEVYPVIRAEADHRDATILFLDEMTPTAEDDCAIASEGADDEFSVFAVLTLRREQHFCLRRGTVRPTDFVRFCADVRKDFPGNVILITDVSALHTASEVTEFVRSQGESLKLVYFPHYG